MVRKKAERRHFPRRQISLPIQIKLNSYDDFIQRYVTDISAGGLFVLTPTPYEEGDVVNIEFYLQEEKQCFFKVRGVVNRVNDKPKGMGIQFTEIEEGSQKLLDEMLSRPSS